MDETVQNPSAFQKSLRLGISFKDTPHNPVHKEGFLSGMTLERIKKKHQDMGHFLFYDIPN